MTLYPLPLQTPGYRGRLPWDNLPKQKELPHRGDIGWGRFLLHQFFHHPVAYDLKYKLRDNRPDKTYRRVGSQVKHNITCNTQYGFYPTKSTSGLEPLCGLIEALYQITMHKNRETIKECRGKMKTLRVKYI